MGQAKEQNQQLAEISFSNTETALYSCYQCTPLCRLGPHNFFLGAKSKAGFDKNPFSFCYTTKVKHIISAPYSENYINETERNQALIAAITSPEASLPKLYPQASDHEKVKQYKTRPYICISPASVWFTKQFPAGKWIELIDIIPAQYNIFLLGGPSDTSLTQQIKSKATHSALTDLCGQLSYLQSAALMQDAAMNYTNDSAPLHFASAIDAPVTAVFCSTVPAFGFGPLRNNGKVVEIKERLYCRPCGLHGRKACPEGHFRCAMEITNERLLWWTSKTI